MKWMLLTLIPLLAVSGAGFFAGHGAVWLFNHIPDRYMPPAGVRGDDGRQRIASVPWKNIFAAWFIVAGIDMVQKGWQYAVAGLALCFVLMLLGVADRQYGTMPQPLLWMLWITGMGFTPFAAGLFPMLKGTAVGTGAAVVLSGVLVLQHRMVVPAARREERISEGMRWDLVAFGAAAGWSLGGKGIAFVLFNRCGGRIDLAGGSGIAETAESGTAGSACAPWCLAVRCSDVRCRGIVSAEQHGMNRCTWRKEMVV